MKRLFLLVFILSLSLGNYAQKRIQFNYKDDSGCAFVFKTETANSQDVALVSASNKKNARLEIPENVSYKGNTYVVTRIESEALKKCDNAIRELVFPKTVETIGGSLFGGVMKLSGGLRGILKGGTGGPLSKIRLDRIVIPHNVYAIGGNAFITGYTDGGTIQLHGAIDELPLMVMPWSAKDYGLDKKDVIVYWQKTDTTRLSPILAAEAKHKKLCEYYERTPPHKREEILKYFISDDEISKEAAKALLVSVSDYGITQEEFIGAYQGYYSENDRIAYIDEMYSQFEEDVVKGNISLLPFVEQVAQPNNDEQQILVRKFEKYEIKGNYKSALSVATKMMNYTSDPRLRFVRAVCLYKTNKYKKSMDDCLLAINDGRLTEDEMDFVGMMASISADKYVEKVMQKVEKWERLLGVAEQVAEQVAVDVINKAFSKKDKQKNVNQGNDMHSGSSDYYTSSAYLDQVNARADQFMADVQKYGEQSLNNFKRKMERGNKMFADMANWSLRFKDQTGREPTELEYCQWVQKNYPDMYDSYLQAQAARYNQLYGESENDEEEHIEKKTISNTYDCSYCGGSGRLLQDDETLSFGLPSEKEYKCNECGKWKIKGKTHRHYDCPYCKGKGKVTFQ